MAEVSFPGIDGNQDIGQLTEQVARMRKELSWLLENLDHLNVKRLYTEYCQIQSEEGETVIDGPQLLMYDKQITPQLRLEQGYDSVTGDFLFKLYNSAGANVLGLSSAGEISLSGKPLFEMYDDQVTPVKRLSMGYDTDTAAFLFALNNAVGDNVLALSSIGEIQLTGKPLFEMYDDQATPVERLAMGYDDISGDFLFELYNKAGIKTVGVDSNGDAIFTGIITGGTVRTAENGERIEITNNELVTFDSNGDKHGMVIGEGAGGQYGDVYLYDRGTKVLEFYNNLLGAGYTIRPANSASLYLGTGGTTVYSQGNWDFSIADAVTGLSTDTDGSHTHGGAVPADGGHSHTVTN